MQKSRDLETVSGVAARSRVMPLLIAGIFCFCVAALLGFGSWRLFGSTARQNGDTAKFFERFGLSTAKSPPLEVKPNMQKDAAPVKTPEVRESPAKTTPLLEGVVHVDGGETAVGGGVSLRPLQRKIVEPILIAETEVTNAEYQRFVKATDYRRPEHWKRGKIPVGMEDHPVVFVSYDDAQAFCKWKAKELGMIVRLPGYAEWLRAAGGTQRFKFPWGNEWNETAVSSKKQQATSPVKNFDLNRSPFGAYDMVGNVWEWTRERLKKNELISDRVKSGYSKNSRIHLVLGGSFNEDRNKLANSFWAEIDAKTRNESVGFRYVIIPDQNKEE
ncbi:MAG: SUMF1/EgtB/PvdO family nonheme iron enzyme [Pyrinomonadaceae bacterium]|nr:SUMF1/EgtB/PvdO family nonheme iron enzyme [Pyrinomonadaceae bacterium]